MIALLKQNFGVQTRGILGLMRKWRIEKIIRENAFEQNSKKPPGGTPYFSHIGMCPCAAPKGMVFGSFWSENGYTLFPFWSGIEYSFRGN